MRKFSSYGPINTKLHYYAPREGLIEQGYRQLMGDDPDQGGHYITVWAPRQTGKTWLMQQIVQRIKASGDFEAAITTMQSAKSVNTVEGVLGVLLNNLRYWLNPDLPDISAWAELPNLFTAEYFSKPVILILDEFDALQEEFINKFANEFRSMFIERGTEVDKVSGQKRYLLHGLALIGVRSVLGIENVTGSPFNVQRSLRVPNLTRPEVEQMFRWYQQESNQSIEPAVIERLFYEVQGQPGLTCWFGELLTETYNDDPTQPLTMSHFDRVFMKASNLLPNNNILNIISKAQQAPAQSLVLELFRTDEKVPFRYDNPQLNYLYLNGVIDVTEEERETYVKFASPFVQKRLFNYFAENIFHDIGQLYEPFTDLSETITEEKLNIKKLLSLYERYLQKNRRWLLDNAPRRKDLRIYEAVYHFNLYMYLQAFLRNKAGEVYPEFPAGNGQVDLMIKYRGQTYGLELKSFTDEGDYKTALGQAARYGRQLKLSTMTLVFFVETIDEAHRNKYEVSYRDNIAGVQVRPIFIQTKSVAAT